MAREAEQFHKRLASLIAKKRGNSYSDTIAYIRRKVQLCLLRSTLAAIRGFRGGQVKPDDINSDINTIDRVTE